LIFVLLSRHVILHIWSSSTKLALTAKWCM